MYQTPTSVYPTTHIAKLNDIIVDVVDAANKLIKEVSPDYSIDNQTGAINGKRQRPSLTGELSYEPSQIGYMSLGFDPVNGSAGYYRDEPFNTRIEEIYQLNITKLEERKANLDDPNVVVTQYEIISLACLFPGMFLDALAVVLSERGFLVEYLSAPNLRNPANRLDGGAYGYGHNNVPAMIRTNREQFINNWKHYLTGAPYKSAFEAPTEAQTNQPDVEVDNQADQQ